MAAEVAGRSALPGFLVVGAIGFAVDLGAFLLARALLPDVPARGLALLVAITATWWLNRRFAFRSNDPARFAEWARYLAGSAVGAGVNALVSLGALWALPSIGAPLALAAGSAVALLVNYFLAKHVVFRGP